ncbi:hypothetical protein [Aestuariispira insulae]|uniref:DUF4164 family protein n=1 Tax=Aestuariispira insulae TaxID=1461337 RepID=A0A3D9HJY0_9PROT|nr:hypothetical protein [Aestuariispira insulae]RED49773.1 hypothetical protein DFP90_105144 [Aestuariispira insulae]
MTSLEEAKHRLETALARLDQAVSARLDDLSGLREGEAGHQELRQDCQTLRAENGELRQLTEQTASRLEVALTRLGNVLESTAS